jgi:MoxR-like ATPase
MIEAAHTASSYQSVFKELELRLQQRIIGQEMLLTRLLIALIADGHLLVEGAPGLAKTTAIKELAANIEGNFHRIQFTPDLLPSDITGTEIYRPQDGSFHFQQGPIFHNLILSDEINRAPAKVQAALLEAMAERQVSVGRTTYPLSKLFLVMATQNPLEQEGTYPLPEAQLDRFLMYVRITYPTADMEKKILHLARRNHHQDGSYPPQKIMTQECIFAARQEIMQLHFSVALEEYLVQLVVASRNPKPYSAQFARWVRYGASPRATIGLDRCARAHAWLRGKDYVSPEDIHAVAHDILRHRILLTFEAEAEGITSDHFISELLNCIAVP